MGLFNKKQAPVAMSERVMLENKYLSSRGNILLVVLFTLVNIIIAVTGGDTYFLFSASIPYYIAFFAALWCGKMPAEYYEGTGLTEVDFWPSSALIVAAVIAVIIIALYFLFWLFSKKKVGWLIAALVFFSLDTVFMFAIFGFSTNMLFDIVFHAWVIISFAIGINAHCRLKKLPNEPITELVTEPSSENTEFNDGFDYHEYTPENISENNSENE